ncbi:calcium-binding protein, partial [Brevundimonas sp.]
GFGGDDVINGGGLLDGGDGDDQLSSMGNFIQGPTTMLGGAGDDTMNSSVHGDLMIGGEGSDSFIGGDGADEIVGDFNDRWMNGDNGNDILRVSGQTSGDDLVLSVSGGAGTDLVDFSGATAFLTVDLGYQYQQQTGAGSVSISGIENAVASEAGSRITGTTGANRLEGRSGADILSGAEGADVLLGESGSDTLNGGLGNDTLDGGTGVDKAVFSGNRAAYTISTAAGVTTVTGPDGTDRLTNIERLEFADGLFDITGAPTDSGIEGTTGDDLLVGTADDDTITGLDGDDTISGGAGDDTITGGRGNDRVDGGSGDDVLVVSGAISDYRLLMQGDDFILKGPDGGDWLTGVESVRFADGRVLELNRMYGPGVDSGAWADGRIPEALLSGGSTDGNQPLVLPGVDDDPAWNGKGHGEPLILPDLDDAAPPLFQNLEARLALAGDGMLTLDEQGGLAGEPGLRHDDWM